MSFSAKSKYKWLYVAPGKEQKFGDYERNSLADDNAFEMAGKEKLENYTGPTYKIRIGKLTFYAIKGLNSLFVVPSDDIPEAKWIGNIGGKKNDIVHFFQKVNYKRVVSLPLTRIMKKSLLPVNIWGQL